MTAEEAGSWWRIHAKPILRREVYLYDSHSSRMKVLSTHLQFFIDDREPFESDSESDDSSSDSD